MHRASALLAASLLSGLASPAAGQRAGSVEIAALGVWHNKTTTMDGLRAYGAGARLGIWLPLGFELEGQLDVTSSRNSAVDNRFRRCANSPLGALVDGRGCPTDSDGDGVPDGIDRCPGTAAGATVDRIGCVPRQPD